MNQAPASKLKPALIGGGVLGVLSGIPFVNFLNCACCSLVIGGGVLAAYLYLKDVPPTPQARSGDGAVVGLLAGLFGAVVATLVAIPFNFLQVANYEQVIDQLSEAGLPPEAMDILSNMSAEEMALGAIVIGFFFNLVLFSIFGAVGGLIGAAAFHKKPPLPTPGIAS